MKNAKTHILPISLYLGVGAALLFLTATTVAVSLIDFKALVGIDHLNVVIAMIIASIKIALVGLFFMHLLYDNKLFTVIFVTAILFLGILSGLTLFDTLRRGDVSPIEKYPIQQQITIPPAA